VSKKTKATPKREAGNASPSNVIPFNPLERNHLGASVAQALLATKPRPLGALATFVGAGIYAIYYVGDFAPYRLIAEANRGGKFDLPIYVGKAIPQGARMGGGNGKAGRDLQRRLREHAQSVTDAENLELDAFYCRHLVVEDIWIPLGEALLISKFAPLWNSNLTGFGNHNPGKGRSAGKNSRWDLLHPGRAWAGALTGEQTIIASQLAGEAENYLREFTMPTSQLVQDHPALPDIALNFDDDETDA